MIELIYKIKKAIKEARKYQETFPEDNLYKGMADGFDITLGFVMDYFHNNLEAHRFEHKTPSKGSLFKAIFNGGYSIFYYSKNGCLICLTVEITKKMFSDDKELSSYFIKRGYFCYQEIDLNMFKDCLEQLAEQ